ncbi:unnamed protein product [Bemisia tabaci]|uniref:Ubiquitin-like protease family profile domain-containing protein n=1 Tax=Bemisia tabaci TaxID=7038 RepID=A0A9P0F2Q9_BEMTA|nr:unnamed protein product [Bemisia tabaci]
MMVDIFRHIFSTVNNFWREKLVTFSLSPKRPRSSIEDDISNEVTQPKRLKLSKEAGRLDDCHFTPQGRHPLRPRRTLLDENTLKMSRINEQGNILQREQREAQARQIFQSNHGIATASTSTTLWKTSVPASLSPRSYQMLHKDSTSRLNSSQSVRNLQEKNAYNDLLSSILQTGPIMEAVSTIPMTQAGSNTLVKNVVKSNEFSILPMLKGTASRKDKRALTRRSDLNLAATIDLTKDDDPSEDISVEFEKIKTRTPRCNSFESALKREAWSDPIFCKSMIDSWRENNIRKLSQINLEEKKKKVLQEVNGKVDDQHVTKRLKDILSLKEAIIDEPEIEEIPALPELTPEMEEKVEKAWACRNPGQVFSEAFGLRITQRDLITLARLNWLNDEVINFYMNLLMERNKLGRYPKVYAFNTFFYPKLVNSGHASLKRWTKKVDIFSHDLIVVPVHLGVHWCMSIIDFRKKAINYYDSMGHPNQKCLSSLLTYLRDESMDKKKVEFDASGWTLACISDIPMQMNGSDCGMFACMFAEYLTRDVSITFSQENMPYFRKKMAYEILTKQLLEFK